MTEMDDRLDAALRDFITRKQVELRAIHRRNLIGEVVIMACLALFAIALIIKAAL